MTDYDFFKQLSDTIVKRVKIICKDLDYNSANECVITQVNAPGKYKVKINEKVYAATSYFDFSVGNTAYAIAPQNNYSKLFLLPYHK